MRAVQTLRIISAAQRLGFTFEEVADLHQRATSDCCPLPFVEITTRATHAGARR